MVGLEGIIMELVHFESLVPKLHDSLGILYSEELGLVELSGLLVVNDLNLTLSHAKDEVNRG